MKNTDDFWTEHHWLFDSHFAYFDRTGQKKTRVWGKYRVADEHYFDVRYELVPIRKPSGTRTYIMLHLYVLQPKLTMTVGLY